MLLNLLIKRAAWNTEAFGCFLHAASLLLQDPLDMLLFKLQQGET